MTDGERTEQLKQSRDAAQEANRARTWFVANISHELRTPLTAIIGFANLLLKNKNGNLADDELDFVERILRNASEQLRVINGLLDLSQMEAGAVEIIAADVELGLMITEMLQQYERQRQKNIQLVTSVPADLKPIRTDAAKLRQVLTSLLDNAVKFTDLGSVTIRVETGPDDRTPLRIDVSDTGVGIAPDRIDTLFEPFYKIRPGASYTPMGIGLGLSVSRLLCELMGYRLQVQSNPGTGSTFSLILQSESNNIALSV